MSLAAPVDVPARLDSLDVLRGFALLGILVMNIQSFSMPFSAYVNPTVWGDLTGADGLVWLVSHVLADSKMIAIFSMLFGAGIVLFADRIEARGEAPGSLHFRRNLWLILFGVLHAYLLWYGDILFLYGVCALVVYWFRRWTPLPLLLLGTFTFAVGSLTFLAVGWSMQFWSPEEVAGFVEQTWHPPPEWLAAEVEAYRGGWFEQMTYRAPVAFELQTFVLALWSFWHAAGLMLIGMALYKLEVFSALRSERFYLGLFAVAALVGIPLIGYGVHWNFGNDWGPLSFFHGTQFNYWGSLLVSLGWVGAVMFVCRRGLFTRLTRRLAAVGRTAFSNYILQTLICTTLFYGHGLGLFGQLGRTGQLAIVLGVWALQLALAPVWLRHFRFGPLEWLWRCLTYWRRYPFRAAGRKVATVST